MNAIIAGKIDTFFAAYPNRKFRKGEVLIQADEMPGHVFHLTKGRVKQYDISPRGDEVILNVFKEQAFFPMSCAINEVASLYTYQAEEDVETNAAPSAEVVAFVQANPDIMFNLLSRVYRGTDGLLGRLAYNMAGTARSRLAYELLIQVRRFGKPSAQGITIPASQADIAAQVGLARETVSRELARFKQEGAIITESGQIVVRDVAELAEMLNRELRVTL